MTSSKIQPASAGKYPVSGIPLCLLTSRVGKPASSIHYLESSTWQT